MRRITTLAVVGLTVSLAASCSLFGGSDEPSDHKVVLVTHDSFEVAPELLEQFRKDSGITVDVRKSGDAGSLANQLVLTKGSPIGDIAFGVDNTFASRPLSEGVFASYASPELGKGSHRYKLDDTNRLTAVDVGDVCVNIDPAALAAKNVPEPVSLEDLANPKYKDMLVVTDPATSSPGLAFLATTATQYGEKDWPGYWKRLKANGVKVVGSWEEAYTKEFSGSSGKGPRPIVVSYASSPAAEAGPDGKPRTKALLDTCFRQVEYAGVLNGAKNPDDARKVLDFLLSEAFQKTVPESMYVFPAREYVALPAAWQQTTELSSMAAVLPPEAFAERRESWITQWRTVVQG